MRAHHVFRAEAVVFVGCMAIGYALHPGLVADNLGVSNFWFTTDSRVVYAIGLLAAAVSCLALAVVGSDLDSPTVRRLRWPLVARGVLALGVFGTSPLLRGPYNDAHYVVGGAFLGSQLLVGGILLARRRTAPNLVFLALGVAGTALALVTSLTQVQVMLVGQVLALTGYLGSMLYNLGPDGGPGVATLRPRPSGPDRRPRRRSPPGGPQRPTSPAARPRA